MSTQETAQTSYLEVSGTKFAYRFIGKPSSSGRPPLLLLNHFRSTIDLWDPELINALTAAGNYVITYDYAGIGHSGGKVAKTIRGFATDLAGFIRALLPTLGIKSVDVLGFSIGGYVAQQLALIAPELVGKLVLSGTGPSSGPGLERPMAEVQSSIMKQSPDGGAIVDSFFPSFVAKEAGGAWLTRSIGARQAVAGKDGEPDFAFFLPDGEGLYALTEAYLSWDADPVPYSLLQTVQKDVLVTAGKSDLIVPTQNSYILSKQLPRASLVVYPGSGHGHLFQFAAVYAQHVTTFLNGDWPVPPFSAGEVVRR